MTNEEAIQKLEMYKGVISDLINIIAESKGLNCFEFDTEPFDMAIEALKLEPKKTHKMTRKEAWETIIDCRRGGYKSHFYTEGQYQEALNMALESLMAENKGGNENE